MNLMEFAVTWVKKDQKAGFVVLEKLENHTNQGKKKALYLSVNVFSTKVLIGDTIFLRLLMETGTPFYVVIRATRRSSHLQGKGSTFISQLF